MFLTVLLLIRVTRTIWDPLRCRWNFKYHTLIITFAGVTEIFVRRRCPSVCSEVNRSYVILKSFLLLKTFFPCLFHLISLPLCHSLWINYFLLMYLVHNMFSSSLYLLKVIMVFFFSFIWAICIFIKQLQYEWQKIIGGECYFTKVNRTAFFLFDVWMSH